MNDTTAKYVTFFNEKFQRGKPELLKEIQRSTKGGQNAAAQQMQVQEISSLKDRVQHLENTIATMQREYDDRLAALEANLYRLVSYSNGQNGNESENYSGNMQVKDANYDQNDMPPPHSESVDTEEDNESSRPTLPPHPNSKVLPQPGVLPPPPQSLRHSSFLRGLSNASMSDLGFSEMTPFEQKYLQSAMSNPDLAPVESSQATLTRQMSESIDRLDLNDFPPLSG